MFLQNQSQGLPSLASFHQQPQDLQKQAQQTNQTKLLDANDQKLDISQSSDSMSCVKFSPLNQTYQQIGRMLVGANWDCSVYIWKIVCQHSANAMPQTQVQMMAAQKLEAPVLEVCWLLQKPALLLACVDGSIRQWDIIQSAISVVGNHQAPVKSVQSFCYNGIEIIVSGGWDSRVKFWTQQGTGPLHLIADSYVAMPVHYMSLQYPLLVTAHQDRLLHVWNLEANLQSQNFAPTKVIESTLNRETTSIACFPDGKGFALGSIEGRCSIRNIDFQRADNEPSKDFNFKCHREEGNQVQPTGAYSLNGIAFNRQYGTFATIGGDGHYTTWNKDSKSKYKTSPKFPNSLTAVDFSEDGTLLAFAVGYDYSQGQIGLAAKSQPIKLILRTMDIKTEVFKPPQQKK